MSTSRCPKCTGSLQATARKDPRVAACDGCSGLWLDAASLSAALQNPLVLWNALAQCGAESDLPCPACTDRTLHQAMVGNSELEWCPACRGVFFDRGEIEKVRAAQGAPNEPSTLARVGDGAGFVAGEIVVDAISWAVAKVADSL